MGSNAQNLSETDTCLFKYGLDNLTYETKFSTEQIAMYCPQYAEIAKFNDLIDSIIGLSMAVTGAIGFLSYILMYVIFSQGHYFEGPSFLYHKAMAVMELVHMVVMCQYGVLRTLQFPGGQESFWMVWWRDLQWGGWKIGNSAKFAINTLTNFVAVERLIAVWFPLKFDLFNRNKVAIGAIVVSCLITGALHLPTFAGEIVVERFGIYITNKTEFGLGPVQPFIQIAISSFKMAYGWVTLVLCLLIALGMYLSNKNASSMSSDAQNRWKLVKMACYLQMILGITTVVDHVAFAVYQVVGYGKPYPYVGKEAILRLESCDDALSNLDRMIFLRTAEIIQALAAEIDHGGRLFFYLMFHSTFRESFKELWEGIG